MPRYSIHEYLGVPEHWKVIDKGIQGVTIMPGKQDIKGAKRADPLACAIHNAACRQLNIPNCAISIHCAYIPMRDTKGKPYIARLHCPPETRKAIENFDKTGKIPEGGFAFVPFTESQQLRAVQAYTSRRRRAGVTNANTGNGTKHKLRRLPTRQMPRGMEV